VEVLGDDTLRAIARELVSTVRAQLRVLVRRILRKHGNPPNGQEKATQTVLEQAEVRSEEWAASAWVPRWGQIASDRD
jgi:type I restriction enzyme R subunit